MSNKHYKNKYNETFKVVQKVVNEWDPVGLLSLDCPVDEYNNEIQRITSASIRVNNPEALARKINEIFHNAFDEEFKKEDECLMVAFEIFRCLE